jgi:hypothetical protein
MKTRNRGNMKTNEIKISVIAVFVSGLLYPSLANANENRATVPPDRISLFKVPLVCPAAPQIGCGGASKPILLQLEREPGVLEAWLNRAGTRIAIVWKPESNAAARRTVAAALKDEHATELDQKARDETLQDFQAGKPWYRGADVDRLSEEEADVIAARLVRWVQAKTALTKEKAESLQRALDDTLRKDLTGGKHRRIEEVGRDYLDEDELKILRQAVKDELAIENGELPVPKEG